MKESWCALDIKQKIAIITAIVAFIAGWALTIAGFVVPPIGEIADSVLWVLGQALIYASSVFGITSYFSSETTRMKTEIKDELKKRFKNETETD